MMLRQWVFEYHSFDCDATPPSSLKVKVAQLSLTLCEPLDYSPPDLLSMESSRVAISFSRGIFPTQISCVGDKILYCPSHQSPENLWSWTEGGDIYKPKIDSY